MSTPGYTQYGGRPPQGIPQAGAPAQPVPQGYSTAPQGFAPGYASVPQGPVVQKVNRLSIILGIVGWVLVGLTVLGTWLAIRAIPSNADPSGADIVGFLPLFALLIIGPVNLAGGIAGIAGAVGKPKIRKLNWLGILLNASPYAIFLPSSLRRCMSTRPLSRGSSHASMMIDGARPPSARSQGRAAGLVLPR